MISVDLFYDLGDEGVKEATVNLPSIFGSMRWKLQEKYIQDLFEKEFGLAYDPYSCDWSLEVHCEDAVFDCGDNTYEVVPRCWYDVRDYMPEDILLDKYTTKTKTLKVLVAIQSRETGQYTVRSQTRQRNKYLVSSETVTWDWGKYTSGVITHWMPLPKAPGFEIPDDGVEYRYE